MAVNAELKDLIDNQSGVIARWQARALDVTEKQIRYAIQSGSWQVAHDGVYATFSGPLTRAAQLWAAVLLCSKEIVLTRRNADDKALMPDAVVSHETAAELHQLRDGESALIHVWVPTTRRKPVAADGIKVHFSSRLDQMRHPVLNPPRTRMIDTVVELTQTARTTDQAIGWLSRACGKRLATPDQLLLALQARKKLRWRHELIEGITDVAGGSHSLLEIKYHKNVERAHGLPEGRRQRRRVTKGGVVYEDVAYDAYDAVVELDGRRGHEYEERFRDHRRDNATVERGAAPLRYGYADVDLEPCRTAVQVGRVLARGGWTGRLKPCERPDCTATHGKSWVGRVRDARSPGEA